MTKSALINIKFIWVPYDMGGHISDPYINMRLGIRWQKHVKDSQKILFDIECKNLKETSKNFEWEGSFSMVNLELVSPNLLKCGELIELINGYRVLGVGVITI